MTNKTLPKQLKRTIVFTILLFGFCIKTINAQGPNAPEAASFEPVDATDMVNLLTGDFTYVLPLLNVPSPEGGYPIALSYHAGIAMDQEASWVGLGWNINPGAINRSVNGQPDDYKRANISEYFYDEGEYQSFSSFSIGYSAFGGTSVGVGFSWGSNQSLGGFVSLGLGFRTGDGSLGINTTIGTNGSSIGLGYSSPSGLTVGVSASSNGNAGINAGFNSNGAGLKVGASTSGEYSIALSNPLVSLDFNISSTGVGMTVRASMYNEEGKRSTASVGIGQNRNFYKTFSQGDYSIEESSRHIAFFVPTPIGFFDFSFSKQEINYYAALLSEHSVSGAYYLGNGNIKDFYEIPLLESNLLDDEYNIERNNPISPAYDNFNVQAQGLSGSIHAKSRRISAYSGIRENRVLEGQNAVVYHQTLGNGTSKVNYYFDNEISTYLEMPKIDFVSSSELPNILSDPNSRITDLHGNVTVNNTLPKKSNHIDHYTNQDILAGGFRTNSYGNIVNMDAFLHPSATGFDRSKFPGDGIGAYIITATDGKTYHYSLPVYNYSKVSRTYGMSSFHKGEPAFKAYQEQRQLEPYATHWLLTAVTGPDFVDNGNGVVDEGDLGYWVSFEYGLWDDAYVWQGPHGKEYHVNEEDPDIKSWVRGIKQQYFLDRIKTRTHTALFLKNEREDARSPYWQYWSVDHISGIEQDGNDYKERFTIPQHKTLRLDKIILVKNEHDVANKSQGGNIGSGSVDIKFPYKDTVYEVPVRTASYSMKNNVFDWTDNWQDVKDQAIKVICFDHTNTGNNVLAKGAPYTGASSEGRLTLTGVYFDGKQGARVMPPYRFDYIKEINNSQYTYNASDSDDWGYNFFRPEVWSLNEIKTPIGGKIVVNYEPHNYKSLTDHEIVLRDKDKTAGARDANGYVCFSSKSIFNLQVNTEIDLNLSYSHSLASVSSSSCASATYYYDVNCLIYQYDSYKGKAVIKEIEIPTNSSDPYIIKMEPNDPIITVQKDFSSEDPLTLNTANYDNGNCIEVKFGTSDGYAFNYGGGVRVKSVATTDNINTYTSEYKYGQNQDGIGWVSYIPFAPEAEKEIPYSFELPAPKPMYEYVKQESLDNSNQVYGSTIYQFNVMNQSSDTAIEYGDFYKLNIDRNESFEPAFNIGGGGHSDVNISGGVGYVDIANYSIEDNLNSIGQLLSVASFNSKDQLLSKLVNEYYSVDELPNNIGIVEESYQMNRRLVLSPSHPDYRTNLPQHWHVNNTKRIKYPSLLKSSTEHKNGFSYTTRFDNFDPISGQAKEVYSFSSNGTEFKSVSEPAFREYPEMGSKVDDNDNKNMLSQEAETLSYFKTSPTDNWKLYNAKVQTWYDWNSSENIWRKHKNFTWRGDLNDDGSYQSFVPFNWGGPGIHPNNLVQDSGWQELSEITKYNDFSRVLEVKDINENYASTKTCDGDSKVLAVCNVAYTEMYYSGAEYRTKDIHGNIFTDGLETEVIRNTDKSHTGLYSIAVDAGEKCFQVVLPHNTNRIEIKSKFKISVWVEKANYTNARIYINGSTKTFNGEVVAAGDWVQLNHYEDVNINSQLVYVTSVSGLVYFDDFRLQPIASSMTSYVYNQWDELWCIIGNNGLATKFEYDAAGRLTKTYTEVVDDTGVTGGFKPISENRYNYKQQQP